jgi:hypothetical protein
MTTATVTRQAEVLELFPTPFMRVARALTPEQVAALIARFTAEAELPNQRSGDLTHSRILPPRGCSPCWPTSASICLASG